MLKLDKAGIVVCIVWVFSIISCGPDEPHWISLSGNTMGTTYHIQYFGTMDLHRKVDALLEEINNSVSTYIPTSTISRFNDSGYLGIALAPNGEPQHVLDGHFLANLEAAYEVFKLSDGYFDPTVGPLVEAWGFGSEGHQDTKMDSSDVKALLARVGMQYIEVDAKTDTIHIRALRKGMHLDFSALAKGYAVDRVFELVTGGGQPDAFVEIGGEVRVGGKSPRGDDWIVGINTPEEGADFSEVSARLHLRNAAMATSGNYRNYYLRNGRKVWHTMNPKTGYPDENSLMSASIVHDNCMMADALATASMAMGVDDAIGMIWKVHDCEGYFIYRDLKGKIATYITEDLKKDVIPE